MMDYQDQLRIQAYLDGELPEAEARQVAHRLEGDPDAAALLAELRQTRQALSGFESEIQLPESRPFYWSKIEREIKREMPPLETPASVPLILRLRRFLVPVAGLALLLGVGLLATQTAEQNGPIETALADPGAMIYHDYSAGATFVWLSYPADNELGDDDDSGTFE